MHKHIHAAFWDSTLAVLKQNRIIRIFAGISLLICRVILGWNIMIFVMTISAMGFKRI